MRSMRRFSEKNAHSTRPDESPPPAPTTRPAPLPENRRTSRPTAAGRNNKPGAPAGRTGGNAARRRDAGKARQPVCSARKWRAQCNKRRSRDDRRARKRIQVCDHYCGNGVALGSQNHHILTKTVALRRAARCGAARYLERIVYTRGIA